MNTNTIRIHYDDSYEREKQQRCFPQRSKIKVAHVCSLKPALDTHRQSADLYRRTPCDRYICRRRVFSIRRAHGAPLESIRLRFVFLFSFFLFHFGGRLVVSSFSRPTERKPKRERGVCSSRGRIQPYRTSRRLPPRCKGFGFGFDARRRLLLLLFSSLNAPFARTMVVFVVSIFICARAHF